MVRSVTARIFCCATLTSLAIALACLARPTAGQEKQADAEPPAAQKVKAFRGRLPNYYRLVVDQKQREMIYKIQAGYAPKIADLKAQLDKLTEQRDREIAAVLTPAQRKKVEGLRAAAAAKRGQQKKKAAKEKPAPKIR